MAYTGINKSSEHFNTKLYTGNGSTQTITGVGFQPDWTWLKGRDAGGESHRLTDVIRGTGYNLRTNSSGAEIASSNMLTSWNSDGFAVGANDASNKNTKNFVSWNWKANGAGSANTAGSINSTVSVNTTSGFSIVKYTANGTQGATVGHGIGVKPNVMIIKNLDSTLGDGEVDWGVYHSSLTATNFLKLNTTQAQINTDGTFNDTEPSNTLFTLGGGSQGGRFITNRTGDNYIAYCFADVKGYSKMGSYTGNGSSSGDGSFIYTGFKPSFLMVKRTNGAKDWHIFDTARSTSNVVKSQLEPNTANVENTSSNWVDMLSNGFKWRIASGDGEYGDVNGDGDTYIYMAFGQSIVGSNDTPATAR
jgi:hypothetical protein